MTSSSVGEMERWGTSVKSSARFLLENVPQEVGAELHVLPNRARLSLSSRSGGGDGSGHFLITGVVCASGSLSLINIPLLR